MNIGYKINYGSKLLKNKLNKELEEENITASQFATIKDIETNSKNKEVVVAKEIAERLGMDKPTMSGIISRLIDKDYLSKNVNPNDKRSFALKLTKKAKLKLKTLEQISNSVLDEALRNLNKIEIESFENTLNKIISNLSDNDE